MKSTEYVNFTMPIPARGKYELEIVDASEITGKTPDVNGDCSHGIKLTFSVTNDDAMMTDGNTAIGYVFNQTWWEPRQSLIDSKPNVAMRMRRDIATLIKSAFGDSAPEEIAEHDWIGRRITAYLGDEFDEFQGETIVKVVKVIA